MVPELAGMSKPQWLRCSMPWVMDTFEVQSPVTPSLCSLFNRTSRAAREPLVSLQPSPSTQAAPEKGLKATTSWQGKAAIRAHTKPFLVWHFCLKCVLHLGFYSNWEVPILAQLEGVKQPGEWSRRAGGED